MSYARHSYHSKAFLIGCGLTGWILAGSMAQGQSTQVPAATKTLRDKHIDDWFDLLAGLNRYSALEGAYSHGSIGVSVGAGMSFLAVKNASPLLRDQLQTEDDLERLNVPKFWIIKGLSVPVDFGFSAGGLADGSLTQASGHLQWTVYEELAMPALAFRATYGRIFGIEKTNFISTGADVLASYGFLRFFTLYAGVGVEHHLGRLSLKAASESAYLLRQGTTSETIERSWTGTSQLAGLRVMLYPPFVSVTGEIVEHQKGEKSYAAKLALGM